MRSGTTSSRTAAGRPRASGATGPSRPRPGSPGCCSPSRRSRPEEGVTDLVVHPLDRPLTGSVPVPSDKSIGHRSLLFASLCEGVSHIKGFSYGEDNVSTANAMRAMGVVVEDVAKGELKVTGAGLFGLKAPENALDCGNSGTTMRLLTGILAGQRFRSELVGDASLSRRPMMRVAGPLRSRGAIIEGKKPPTKESEILPPLVVGPLPE